MRTSQDAVLPVYTICVCSEELARKVIDRWFYYDIVVWAGRTRQGRTVYAFTPEDVDGKREIPTFQHFKSKLFFVENVRLGCARRRFRVVWMERKRVELPDRPDRKQAIARLEAEGLRVVHDQLRLCWFSEREHEVYAPAENSET